MYGRLIGAYRVTSSASDQDIIDTTLTFSEAGDTLMICNVANSTVPCIVVANTARGATPAACPDPSLSMTEGAAASNQMTGAEIIVVPTNGGTPMIPVPLRSPAGGPKLADQVRIRAWYASSITGGIVIALYRRDEQPA